MTPTAGGRRLATLTIPAPDLRPDAFLRHARGQARGFWARDERWVAHRGVVADLGGAGGDDRFEAVAGQAAALARDPLLAPDTPRAPRVRFYGGFSFRADHVAEAAWSAFPSCRFHLPAFELEGDGTGDAWLRARILVSDEEASDAWVRLRRSSEALRAELASLSEGNMPAGAPVPARAVATERGAWEAAVEESLAAIRAGRVSKVVLARTMDIDAPVDPADVVMHLWAMNRGSHVFFFEPSPRDALVGAAPETIATLRDGVFHATAVAGSIQRGASEREQRELAAALLASEKDRNEQRIVVDDLIARLETVAHQIRADRQPHVLTLARIQHLETEIRASVPAGTGVLDLLRLLHPTPAVCGLPGTRRWTCWPRKSRSSAAGTQGRWGGSTRRATACSRPRCARPCCTRACGACSPVRASWKAPCRRWNGRRPE